MREEGEDGKGMGQLGINHAITLDARAQYTQRQDCVGASYLPWVRHKLRDVSARSLEPTLLLVLQVPTASEDTFS